MFLGPIPLKPSFPKHLDKIQANRVNPTGKTQSQNANFKNSKPENLPTDSQYKTSPHQNENTPPENDRIEKTESVKTLGIYNKKGQIHK